MDLGRIYAIERTVELGVGELGVARLVNLGLGSGEVTGWGKTTVGTRIGRCFLEIAGELRDGAGKGAG